MDKFRYSDAERAEIAAALPSPADKDLFTARIEECGREFIQEMSRWSDRPTWTFRRQGEALARLAIKARALKKEIDDFDANNPMGDLEYYWSSKQPMEAEQFVELLSRLSEELMAESKRL